MQRGACFLNKLDFNQFLQVAIKADPQKFNFLFLDTNGVFHCVEEDVGIDLKVFLEKLDYVARTEFYAPNSGFLGVPSLNSGLVADLERIYATFLEKWIKMKQLGQKKQFFDQNTHRSVKELKEIIQTIELGEKKNNLSNKK